jgi:hypothetical protein
MDARWNLVQAMMTSCESCPSRSKLDLGLQVWLW